MSDPHQLAQVLVDQAEAAGATEHVLHEIRRRCLHEWIVFGTCDVGFVCRRCGLEGPRMVFGVTPPAEPPAEG